MSRLAALLRLHILLAALTLAAARSASAQYVSLGVGAADLHDAAGADRSIGAAGLVAFERLRSGRGMVWRAEFSVASTGRRRPARTPRAR